jgi:hypothetical protein
LHDLNSSRRWQSTNKNLFTSDSLQTGGCEQDLIWTAYTYEYSVKTGCYSGQFNGIISKQAMESCDASMALLAGQHLSVGALGNIAKALQDEGPSAMPGKSALVLFYHVNLRVQYTNICYIHLSFIFINCLTRIFQAAVVLIPPVIPNTSVKSMTRLIPIWNV